MRSAKPGQWLSGQTSRLAAADLTEVAGMMRGLSALAVKRGRPLPLNDTSYTSEDLEAIANRLQQIADHFTRLYAKSRKSNG